MDKIVICDLPNGFTMQIHERRSPPQGETIAVPVGVPVSLRAGENSVDAEFWGKWADQHKDAEFVRNGMIRLKS